MLLSHYSKLPRTTAPGSPSAELPYSNVRVFAFEPVASVFESLQARAAGAGWVAAGWRGANVALGSTEGTAAVAGEDAMGAASLGLNAEYGQKSAKVQMLTLSSAAYQLRVSEVFLLKADAGAYSPHVLAGAADLLRQSRVRWVLFEHSQRWSDVEAPVVDDFRLDSLGAATRWLYSTGYACYAVTSHTLVPVYGAYWHLEYERRQKSDVLCGLTEVQADDTFTVPTEETQAAVSRYNSRRDSVKGLHLPPCERATFTAELPEDMTANNLNEDGFVFTSDWFSPNIPLWQDVLGHMRGQPVHALEVGSYQGMSAVWAMFNILTHPNATLTCVDTWEGAYMYTPAQKRELMAVFNHNTLSFGDRIIKKRGVSQEVLRTYAPRPQFDYVYVDGDHRAVSVLEDAVLAFKLLKVGGVLIFDDYKWDLPVPEIDRPFMAIDAFMKLYEPQVQVLHVAYQVYLKKVAEVVNG